MTKYLNEARILVTRPERQAENLCRLITQQGGLPIRFPTLKIESVEITTEIRQKLSSLKNYQWLIFISANAVNYAIEANNGKIESFQHSQIAVVGKATARTLQQRGLKVDLMPTAGANSESLLRMQALQKIANVKCLIIRGQGGLEQLAAILRSRGALVDYLEVYKRVKPQPNNTVLSPLLQKNKLAVIIITSGEALQNLWAMTDKTVLALLLTVPLLVISRRIEQQAKQLGFKHISVTENPADSAILETLKILITGENSGRRN